MSPSRRRRPTPSPPLAPPSPPLLLALLLLPAASSACREGGPLGPPDSYLVYEPDTEAKPTAPAGTPVFRSVSLEDARAVPIHRAAMDGFVGELLRTDYLVKQLLRDGWEGRAFSAAARARAAEPTVLLLAGSRTARTDEAGQGAGLTLAGLLGRQHRHPDAVWAEVGNDPPSDPAFVQTASGRLGRLVAERLTDAGTAPGAARAPALVSGYAWAMEVIGREWRVGEGPRGTLPPDAGTGTQRERFASVRQNAAVLSENDPHTLRPGAEMLTAPGVIATLIYRMAQSKGVGHHVGPPEIYTPFVSGRVPSGVSPAAVLGPTRNFQVKLLVAWGRAILAGRPPRDLADLVTAYADALPGERAEVMRLFVVTTYGATVKPGGVSPRAADSTAALAELTALAAELTTGRRSLRQGLAAGAAAAEGGGGSR